MCSTLQAAAYAVAVAMIPVCAAAQTPREVGPLNQLTSAKVLDRSAYVRAVLNENPSIEAARQGWRAALARVRQAGAFDDPMLELAVAPLSIGSSSARFGYEVGISQQLPWFGKRTLERDVMKAEAAASESDLSATRRELAMTALLLYDEYFVACRSLEINLQHLALMQSMRSAATAQLAAGRGSTQDALQAEAELTHLEQDAITLGTDRDVAIAQMNELLHRDPEAPLPPPVSELAVRTFPGAPERQSTRLLEQQAVAQRAEIVSARLHARAQAARADAAGRDYYPSFTLSTSYSSMWDMPQHRWMVGVGISLPLPSERRAGVIDEAHAARAQYESEVERMSSEARTQVYVALRKLAESEQLLELFQKRLLPVAREQVDAAQTGFISSRVPFMAVVAAERNLRSVELEHNVAQAQSDRRHAELERALGRVPGLDVEETK